MSISYEICLETANLIKSKINGYSPKLAIGLGSGLGNFTDHMEDKIILPYESLPAFPETTISGHSGNLVIGRLGNVDIVCLSGRVHVYEGKGFDVMAGAIRSLKLAGIETLFLTNAAGSLNENVGPGGLMMITDHINLMGGNPLVGTNDDRFGTRFPVLTEAWDPQLSVLLRETATEHDIPLSQGVYCALLGPSFETAAEVRMVKMLGADAVGMSTVPDCILANHCGLKVIGCSVITNFGVGMKNAIVNHDQTLSAAALATEHMTKLIKAFVAKHG